MNQLEQVLEINETWQTINEQCIEKSLQINGKSMQIVGHQL